MTLLGERTVFAIFRLCARTCTLREARALLLEFRLVSREWARAMLFAKNAPIQLALLERPVSAPLVRFDERGWRVPRKHAVRRWIKKSNLDYLTHLPFNQSDDVYVLNEVVDLALNELEKEYANSNAPCLDLLPVRAHISRFEEFFDYCNGATNSNISIPFETIDLHFGAINKVRVRDNLYADFSERMSALDTSRMPRDVTFCVVFAHARECTCAKELNNESSAWYRARRCESEMFTFKTIAASARLWICRRTQHRPVFEALLAFAKRATPLGIDPDMIGISVTRCAFN